MALTEQEPIDTPSQEAETTQDFDFSQYQNGTGELAETEAPAGTPDFDFTAVNHEVASQAADREMNDEIAAATDAAADKRAGKAGGVFDFSEYSNPSREQSGDDFDFTAVNRETAIQTADREMAAEIAAATETATDKRAGKAGGAFDFSEPGSNAEALADARKLVEEALENKKAA